MFFSPPQQVWADDVPFLDYRLLSWSHVRKLHYTCYQRFHYAYSGPVWDVRQQLIVVPPAQYGDQRLLDVRLSATPQPEQQVQRLDRYGNVVWHVEIGSVKREAMFEVKLQVECSLPTLPLPAVSPTQAALLLRPSPLTTPDARINTLATEAVERWPEPGARAEGISAWVSDIFSYGFGFTGVSTSASEALNIGRGLCQDYAHVMIAICRAAQLPARYVSGHMLGEGGSHAWVEVILPDHADSTLRPFAFDPTNRRRPHLGYAVVATGRDYRDVTPTSGSFISSHTGELTATKHAGLTLVELDDGTLHSAGEID